MSTLLHGSSAVAWLERTELCAWLALPVALALGARGLRARRSRAWPMLLVLALPCATQLACVAARWRQVGHFPGRSLFELYLLVALALPLAALLARAVARSDGAGSLSLDLTCALALALTALVAGRALVLRSDAHPLSPALQSDWFPVHVGLLAAGAACLALAPLPWLALPALRRRDPCALGEVDRASFGLFGAGFVLANAGLAAGFAWSLEAWGHIWSGDARESTALVAWGALAGYGLRRCAGARALQSLPLLAGGLVLVALAHFAHPYLPSSQRSLHGFGDAGPLGEAEPAPWPSANAALVHPVRAQSASSGEAR